MKSVPPAILTFFNAYETYIIAGHREPDGDCIGSSLALASFLQRNGKKTVLLSAGPFKRPEIQKYEPLFVQKIDPSVLPPGATAGNTAVAVIDCSSVDRLGDAAVGLEGFPTVIIDHHATNSGTKQLALINGSAPSTTLLVQAIIEASGTSLSQDEAGYLLFGLCTDTGFFRHLDARSSETFSFASRLVAAGANPKRTFASMNGGKSFGSRILISRILSRMKTYYGGQLIVSWESQEDTAGYGLEGRDSDSLYQLIQSIAGVEAIVIVRQESETKCSVGFRSLDKIDVSIVASRFGGGGHRQASGLSIEGTIADLTPRFIEAFADQFPGIAAT